ncbi:sulfatase/phosphatase domain-containing protein [Variovorax sp. M-6]|uniref:sulfatase/phosphatase domain-containing protein n=1 Tax=Variovorax sp. M-6 TaxID=3233041 RepID=UPI003F9D026F
MLDRWLRNGGERFSDNWPLIGGKMDLTEGGIRVPYIARWPRRIRPGVVSDAPVITMDWTRTMLAAAGVPEASGHAMDGVSLLPLFDGEASGLRERPLFWRMKYRAQEAVRVGTWKYLRIEDNEYLFDLADDERERANRAVDEPARLDAMRSAYRKWVSTVPAIPEDADYDLVTSERDMPGAHLR